ncbi:MAG: hypothetical protein ACKVW3_11725 [Phycisphaerales bacterium]
MNARTTAGLRAASGADGEGVNLSITPPQNPTLRLLPLDAPREVPRSVGGEDWLEASLYLRWNPMGWDALCDQLDAIKRDAGELGEGYVVATGLPGGGEWYVRDSGYRLGQGNRGPLMRWKLERDGIVVGLMNRRDNHPTMPNAHVRITGDVLLGDGDSRRVWDKVLSWLSELGADVVSAKLSRVDAAVDCPGEGVDELVAAFREDRYATRAKKRQECGDECWQVEGGDRSIRGVGADALRRVADAMDDRKWSVHSRGRAVTGFYVGAEPKLRVYDKALECWDLATRAHMIQRRWGGSDQTSALRAEFQLRREWLKEHGVDTVEDWFNKRAAVLAYLCGEWVRFLTRADRHTDRSETLPAWAVIAARFQEWANAPRVADLAPIDKRAVKPIALVKQARGCFERLAAMVGESIDGTDDFLGFSAGWLHRLIEGDVDLPARVRAKAAGVA